MNILPTSSALLKNQTKLFQDISDKKMTVLAVLELVSLALIGTAIFGAVMSISFPHWWHAMDVMWKLILLLFGTQALCLPALFVFSSIRGSKLTLLQLILFVICSTTTTAIVLLALSPIAWFFTWSSDGNIEVISVLNAAMIAFGILFGLILLVRAFHFTRTHVYDILFFWLILVLIVTLQMAHKLQPWYVLYYGNEASTTVITAD